MSDQKPIHTFNVCDKNNNVYTVNVFQRIVSTKIDAYNLPLYKDEALFIQDDIVVTKESENHYQAIINDVLTDLYLC